MKLANVLDGIRDMTKMPGLLFIVDSHREDIAVNEAGKLGIPIVGVLDTNADPDPIDFPIPGNDDAIRSIRLFSAFVADCVLEASAAGSKAGTPWPRKPAGQRSRRRRVAEPVPCRGCVR